MVQQISRWERYGLMGPPAQQLRLAVALDGYTVPEWQAQSLRFLIDSGVATIVAAIIPSTPNFRSPSQGCLDARFSGYRALLSTVWRTPATRHESVLDLVQAAHVIHYAPRSGPPVRSSIHDKWSLAERLGNIDIVLRFGEIELPDVWMTVPKWGVWSLRYGSDSWTNPELATFWHLSDRLHTMRVRLQQDVDASGAYRPLKTGVMPVEHGSFSRTVIRVTSSSADFPLQVCRDIVLGHVSAFSAPPTKPRSTGRRALPKTPQAMATAFRTVLANVHRLLMSACSITTWTVGRLDGGPADIIEGRTQTVRWIRQLSHFGLLADPVIVPGSGGRVVLCESMANPRSLGTIVRLGYPDDGGRPVTMRTVIAAPDLHFSYPSIVATEDGLICVPEASWTGELRAYQLSADAKAALSYTVLLRGIRAIDPTLFHYQGRWWLACTEGRPTPSSPRTSSTHLWLYFADSLGGPWRAHQRNPVVIDPRYARAAGKPFEHAGMTYRPAQDCSRTYGGAISLQRIVELTPTSFVEEHIRTIRPQLLGDRPDGLHTVSVDGDAVMLDGAKRFVRPLSALRSIRVRIDASNARSRVQ